MNYRADFALDGDAIWLNTSHQGALPRSAAAEGAEALSWKLKPYEMTTERFVGVPRRLREAVAQLIGAQSADVILTNGASYGLHLLANGLPLERGDEVVLMRGDFPSNLLPWLALREQGVELRILQPRGEVLVADEVARALGPRTRAVCLSWVHSFSGYVLDIETIGELCRQNGTWLIVNSTQGLGVRSIDVARTPVDALVNAGWKWLCGPYATGFAWITPALRDQLRYNQAYWLSMQTADDLGKADGEVRLAEGLGARRYDVFATANFFNFKPFAAAVEYLLGNGIETIRCHVERLVERLVAGLDPSLFSVASPRQGEQRSSLVFLSQEDPARNWECYKRLQQESIHVAYRRSRLRFSPHLYNLDGEIDRALTVLHQAARF